MAVILIVEDEVFTRESARLTVEDLGHSTLPASDMDEALLILRSTQHIDALFTDIRIDKVVLGGFELARQAIELRPKLRVLYTTGSSLSDKMKAMFVAGASFLPKPYTDHQLHNSMEELLAASF